MNFFKKNLRETLEAIGLFSNRVITVKRIRILRNIKSSNRSMINFIWRALKSLVVVNFLEPNGLRVPQGYKLKYPEAEINIEEVLSQVLRKRKKV